jgi:hypothetical protein
VLWQENHGFSRESPYFPGKSVIFGSLGEKNHEFKGVRGVQVEESGARIQAPGQGIRWAQQAFPKAISKSVISGRR